jgi:hypothetical protein
MHRLRPAMSLTDDATAPRCPMHKVGRTLPRAAHGCAALLVAAAVAACEVRKDPVPGPATPSPATEPATPETPPPGQPGAPPDEAVGPPPAEREWTAGDTRVERQVTGVATLRGVRTGRHDGFDRLVFDFGGDAVPSYRIAYVDRPVHECGSGHTVELPGDGWLAIRFEPARAHDDEGRATIPDRDLRPDLGNVLRLRTICDFEAHLDWVAAVGSPNPYAVLHLRGPERLVVDIRR